MKLVGETEFETLGASYTITNDGVVEATGSFMYANNNQTGLGKAQEKGIGLVSKMTQHSEYNHLICVDANVSNAGAYATLATHWVGIPRGHKRTTLKVSLATEEAPIETHPDFKVFAGTKEEPKNGAIFNDDGTFKKFKTNETCPPTFDSNKFQGVKSYLVPTMIVQKVELNGTPDTSLEFVGAIVTAAGIGSHEKADGSTLTIPTGKFDFLLIGASSEFIGRGQKVSYRYRRSGRERWNDEIYE